VPKTSLARRHTADNVQAQRDATLEQLGFKESVYQQIGHTLLTIMANRKSPPKDRIAAARLLVEVLAIGAGAPLTKEPGPLVNLTLVQSEQRTAPPAVKDEWR